MRKHFSFLLSTTTVLVLLVTVNNSNSLLTKSRNGIETFNENEVEKMRDRAVIDSKPFGLDLDQYHSYKEIYSYIKNLSIAYPEKAELQDINYSYLAQKIPALKIGTKGKYVVVECGIIARDWITVAFGTWLINELLTNSDAQSYANKYQFVIVPVLNLDGYAYSFQDRFWVKTRHAVGASCDGVNANRNWNIAWGTQNSSLNKCSDEYAGLNGFSDPTPKHMKDYMESIANKTLAYFALHSYGQMWLYPYAYTNTKKPSNEADLIKVSNAAASAMSKINGLSFKAGSFANTLYLASGTSTDYIYEKLGVKHVYTVVVRDQGEYGYQLPSDQIKPTSLETWAGLKAALDTIETL